MLYAIAWQKEASYIWQHMARNILKSSLGVVTHKLLNEKSFLISFAIHSIPNSLYELQVYNDLLTYISFLYYALLIHLHTHTHTLAHSLSGEAN